MKVYLASSWRNKHFDSVFEKLVAAGFDVYNFRTTNAYFRWQDIAGFEDYVLHPEADAAAHNDVLNHPKAIEAFDNDLKALQEAHVVVLLLPAGNSAHLEAGLAIGQGTPTYILMPEPCRLDLMYSMVEEGDIYGTVDGVIAALQELEAMMNDHGQGPIDL